LTVYQCSRTWAGFGSSLALVLSACSGTGSSATSPETGGKSSLAAGGAAALGGGVNTGGTGTVGVGGSSTNVANPTGGSLATGGSPSTGGTGAIGGALSTGGTPGTGGSRLVGGGPASGGTNTVAATGGSRPTGGASTAGGSVATGGSRATGGTPSGGVTATGGSRTAGGASGTGGSPATGGSTGTNSCSVSPVTPNATPQAKNLLCYLYSIYKKSVLSGQQETNWNANPTDMSWYSTNIGKYPAVLGSDFMYRDGVSCSSVTPSTTRAIAWWNAGGIVMFRYHMGLPAAGVTCTGDCYQGANCAEPSNTTPNAAFFTNLVATGTAENTSLNAKLDYMAVQIAAMKAANMPVILAIYHETQANGWFWWAMTTSGASFVNLWKYTFNYLTVTKGLNNIIWLMPFSGTPASAFYPGSAYADIGGPDQYTQPTDLLTFNASGNWSASVSVLGNTMPIAMHETGVALQPNSMFPAYPWLLWNVWATYENTVQGGFTFNTVASLQAAYASQYTITRDEIPNLK
jgi:hypothetical protein